MFPAVNATCTDGPSLMFGGALPWEIGDISFTGMATAKSRSMYPTLADIKAIMAEIGDAKKVVLSVYFRAPYVMDDASSLKDAGETTPPTQADNSLTLVRYGVTSKSVKP